MNMKCLLKGEQFFKLEVLQFAYTSTMAKSHVPEWDFVVLVDWVAFANSCPLDSRNFCDSHAL